jgi:hypothetical protein
MIELKKRKGTILISSMSLHIGKMENLWHNKANSWGGGNKKSPENILNQEKGLEHLDQFFPAERQNTPTWLISSIGMVSCWCSRENLRANLELLKDI